mmetsp:Transcript_60173/g.130688  ORF Transcript_60173/g.130688 Transcript_60173/m.130688 type:complete len:95 (-) Transcript_60173:30-314(-)
MTSPWTHLKLQWHMGSVRRLDRALGDLTEPAPSTDSPLHTRQHMRPNCVLRPRARSKTTFDGLGHARHEGVHNHRDVALASVHGDAHDLSQMSC